MSLLLLAVVDVGCRRRQIAVEMSAPRIYNTGIRIQICRVLLGMWWIWMLVCMDMEMVLMGAVDVECRD